jgi:peptide methionine sulfoxide reductase MsrA
MRQGNDVGTQYRSAIYTHSDAQRKAAERSRDDYQKALGAHGFGGVTTEIREAPEFFYAEDYHQQYLHIESQRLLRHRWHGREVHGLGDSGVKVFILSMCALETVM